MTTLIYEQNSEELMPTVWGIIPQKLSEQINDVIPIVDRIAEANSVEVRPQCREIPRSLSKALGGLALLKTPMNDRVNGVVPNKPVTNLV